MTKTMTIWADSENCLHRSISRAIIHSVDNNNEVVELYTSKFFDQIYNSLYAECDQYTGRGPYKWTQMSGIDLDGNRWTVRLIGVSEVSQ